MQMHSPAPHARRAFPAALTFSFASALFGGALFVTIEATSHLIASRSQQTHVVSGSFMPDSDAGSVYRRDMGAPNVAVASSH